MPNRYAASGKGLSTTAATNLISIRSTSSVRAQLLEFVVIAEAATALPNAALFITSVVDTSGSSVTATKEDPNAPSPACSVVTGPTGGTIGSASRRAGFPNQTGSSIYWTFDPSNPLIVPLSLSIVFRNDHASSAGPAISWNILWQE